MSKSDLNPTTRSTLVDPTASLPQRQPGTASLLADFTDLQGQLEHRQPTLTQLRLCRVAAQLAGLISLTLTKLGAHSDARKWGRTAWLAAEESNAADVRSWVRAQEAYATFYARDDPQTAAEIAQHAQHLAGSTPTVGAALAAALEARAYARLGNPDAAAAAILRAETALSGLASEEIIASAFGYNEAQLRFHEGNALTYLGDTDGAWRAQDRALALYDHDDLDRTLIHLDRSIGLSRSGDLRGAATYAADALLQLPAEQRTGIVLVRAQELLAGLSTADGRTPPPVQELREILSASNHNESPATT
jgi:hypothetical protein